MARGKPNEPRDASYFCGARNRAGKPCQQRAGWGTGHPRIGRCKLHGGASPIKHGLYSKVVHEQLRAKIGIAETATPIDQMIEALNLQTALAMEYIGRFGPDIKLTGKDLGLLSDLLEKISRIGERIYRVRQLEAMTMTEGLALIEEFGRLAEKYLDTDEAREAFAADVRALLYRIGGRESETQAIGLALPQGANRAADNTR